MIEPPILCPKHTNSLLWETCTRNFRGCQYRKMLEPLLVDVSKRFPSRHPVNLPEDIQAMPVSTQRKYQIWWKRNGLCRDCGEPCVNSNRNYCRRHQVITREEQRKKQGAVRRNWGSPSYAEIYGDPVHRKPPREHRIDRRFKK